MNEEAEALTNANPEKYNQIQTSSNQTKGSFRRELNVLAKLAIETICIQLGFSIPPFLTASYVGTTFGAVALDGFQLANLVCNLFTLSLLQGLFSASDTLSPQAFGAGNFREVGLVALRSCVASLALVVPIGVILIFTIEQLLVSFGQDPDAALYARQYYSIYILSIPLNVIYVVIWKFLSAQNVMKPLIYPTIFSCVIVLPAALKIGTTCFGFVGSAWAVVVYELCTVILVLLYLWILQPHKTETWPGLHVDVWKDVFHWESYQIYFHLGMGGIIASSEWIYWETLSLAIGTLGVIPLSVHTVPTQLITVAFMVPLGIGNALSVRLGVAIPRSSVLAKHLTIITLLSGTVFFSFVSVLLYWFRQSIFLFFIDDPLVLQGCEQIWWKVCVYSTMLAIYALNMGVATGLGLQWTLGILTFTVLWIVGLPSAWYFGIMKGQSLDLTWHFIYPPYILINVLLWWIFYVEDWEAIAQTIRKREGIDPEGVITCTSSSPTAVEDDDSLPSLRSCGYGSVEDVECYAR